MFLKTEIFTYLWAFNEYLPKLFKFYLVSLLVY